MKFTFHKLTALILVLALTVPFFASCSKPEVNLQEVYKLSETSVDMNVGEVFALLIYDDTYSDRVYTTAWSSDNPAVVTVENTGFVTAVGAGTANITATLTFTELDNKTASYTCAINVTQSVIAVTGISLNAIEQMLDVGGVTVLTPTVLPSDATNRGVSWSSSDPAVAIVSSGVVTALSAGTAVITAVTDDGAKTAECILTVAAPVDTFESLNLNKSSISVNVGKTYSLVASVKPEGINANIIWTSGDDSIATIVNGTVTGVKAGTTTVTATLNDKVTNKVATCKITVNNPSTSTSTPGTSTDPGTTTPSTPSTVKATKVEFDVESITVYVGQTGPWKFNTTVTPSNTTQTGKWSSSDPGVAPVDADGNITIGDIGDKSFAMSTITYTIGSVSASGVVVVMSASSNPNPTDPGTTDPGTTDPGTTDPGTTDPGTTDPGTTPSTDTGDKITHLYLSEETLDIIVGNTVQLETETYPKNVTETLTWKTSDADIATVSDNGLVTGVSNGTALITATGVKSGISASCAVTVKNQQAESIKLNAANISLSLGTSEQLKAILTPADSNDTVTWTSDKPTIVSVDQTGKIYCLDSGTVTITATTSSGKSAICTVAAGLSGTNPGGTPGIPTTKIKVGVYVSASGDLKSGTKYTAKLTFSPVLSATQQATCMFALSTTNSNVVEVYNTYANDFSKNDFTLVPGQDGSATLSGFISSTDESLVFEYESKTVSVNSPSAGITTPIKTISMSSTSMSLYSGDTASLIASVSPATNDDTVTWSSSNEAVVSVTSNGLYCTLRATGAGTATITCKSKGNLTTNNRTATCSVTVKSLGSIDNTRRIISVLAGGSYTPTLADLGIYSGTFMGITSTNVVNGISVSPSGLITVAEGTAVGTSMGVYINYLDATNQYTSAQYTIMVLGSKPTSSATVATVNNSVDVGDTGNLASVYNIDGATYTSNYPAVVSIDSNNGTWVANSSGTATITITKDGKDFLYVKFTVDYETQEANVVINTPYSLSTIADYSGTVASAVSGNTSKVSVGKHNETGEWTVTTLSSTGTVTITITFTDGTKLYLDLTISSTGSSSSVGTLNLVGDSTLRANGEITLTLQASSGKFNGTITWSVSSFSGGTIDYEKTKREYNLRSFSTNVFSIGAITSTGDVIVTATYGGKSVTKIINITN